MSAPDPHRTVDGHCPRCGPDRHADVVGYHHEHVTEDEQGVWWTTDYRILRCRGCDRVYFQTDEIFSETARTRLNPITGEMEEYIPHEIKHWPAPVLQETPVWSIKLLGVDGVLYYLFEEIYAALNNELHVLSAVGIRTAFDRAAELLGVDPAMTFQEKLNNLVALGKVGADERDALGVLTSAGGAAAHRAWRPDPTQLATMVSALEHFLYRTFVLDAQMKRLKSEVPQKPKRLRPPPGDAQPRDTGE
jgi:hypothetical protein